EREKTVIAHEKLRLKKEYEQAEIEARNSTKLKGDLADLQAKESVQRTQAGIDRRLQQEQLEAEREKNAIAHEKLRLKKEYEQAEIEAGHPVTLLKIEREVERLQKELEKRASENRLEELKLQVAMLQEKARHELRKELLPLEQLPAVARA